MRRLPQVLSVWLLMPVGMGLYTVSSSEQLTCDVHAVAPVGLYATLSSRVAVLTMTIIMSTPSDQSNNDCSESVVP